ncbi:unnamed protein product [Blepharisma stoltei]|uniref:Uncharacterized protein n=1 Tax=Blepharisma stoltei TaxID=1481888 RepID=A0AAU9IXN8_9CILI|nr:unnamed protein product [Blepharisma stoltei]
MSSYILFEENNDETPSRLKFNPMVEVTEFEQEERERGGISEIDGKVLRSSKHYKKSGDWLKEREKAISLNRKTKNSVKERVNSKLKSLSPLRVSSNSCYRRKDNVSSRRSTNYSIRINSKGKSMVQSPMLRTRKGRMRDSIRNSIAALTQIYGSRNSKCSETFQKY